MTRILSNQNQVFQLLDYESHLLLYEQPRIKKQKFEITTKPENKNTSGALCNLDSISETTSEYDGRIKIQEEIFSRIEPNRLPVIVNF